MWCVGLQDLLEEKVKSEDIGKGKKPFPDPSGPVSWVRRARAYNSKVSPGKPAGGTSGELPEARARVYGPWAVSTALPGAAVRSREGQVAPPGASVSRSCSSEACTLQRPFTSQDYGNFRHVLLVPSEVLPRC